MGGASHGKLQQKSRNPVVHVSRLDSDYESVLLTELQVVGWNTLNCGLCIGYGRVDIQEFVN